MTDIFTAQFGYKGFDRVDITVGSKQGMWFLRPTWDLVGGHKHYYCLQQGAMIELQKWQRYNPLDDDQYRERYFDLLNTHYTNAPELFTKLLNRKSSTLVCYCIRGKFCHRHLAAEFLGTVGKQLGIEVVLKGER